MNKIKILIVEDDAEMCEELKNILEDENYFVDTAHDAAQGITAIEKTHYKIVLLDLKMQGMNGCELLEYVKKKYPDIRIIILSGSAVLIKPLLKGKDILKLADGVINKPFDVKKVLEKIKELLKSA
jgi:DNA-binding response OmpR family regulator